MTEFLLVVVAVLAFYIYMTVIAPRKAILDKHKAEVKEWAKTGKGPAPEMPRDPRFKGDVPMRGWL